MAAWDRRTHKLRRKTPSFSSSLLDAICDSIDESKCSNERQEAKDIAHSRRSNAAHVEEEIESLRRAIKVERWMENYGTAVNTPRNFPSTSESSTDSNMFSSSETESSASRSTLKSSVFSKHRPKYAQTPLTEKPGRHIQPETIPNREGRFTRTKSRALKFYGDLKRVKEPISPGGKIANFLNSLFSPRNSKKRHVIEEWSSMRMSRSTKDTTTRSSASKSCITQNPSSSRNKPKRSVKFCPVSVILDKDCGHTSIYNDDCSISSSLPYIGSQFTRRNVDTFRQYEEKNLRKHELFRVRELLENESDEDDGMSCASSELFELENIGRVGIGAYDEELPVYGTTSVKMNQAIARGLVI